MKSLSIAALVILVLTGASVCQAASFDAAAAIAKAHALTPHIDRAEAAPLWQEFNAQMRAALKDSAGFALMLGRIHEQTGPLDSVLSESVTATAPGAFTYVASCRFAKVPIALELVFSFDAEGRVSGMLVRPPAAEKRKEYASAFLDYHAKSVYRLPFRGEWAVFWGGRTLDQNYHAFTRDQRFALDLVITRDGATHSGDGSKLADYYCYGQPILASAAGTVVWAQDSLPDQAPGQHDAAHATGNSLIIDHGNGEFSLMAHLQPHSLRFKVGDKVKADAVVGLCGNSGNTSEPHLHFHLQNGPAPFAADGLPVEFTGVLVDGKPQAKAEILRGQKVARQH